MWNIMQTHLILSFPTRIYLILTWTWFDLECTLGFLFYHYRNIGWCLSEHRDTVGKSVKKIEINFLATKVHLGLFLTWGFEIRKKKQLHGINLKEFVEWSIKSQFKFFSFFHVYIARWGWALSWKKLVLVFSGC